MMLHCWTRRSLAAVACCAIVAASMGTVVLLHAQQPATNAAAETALARMEAAYKTAPGAAHQSAVVGQVQRRHVGR